MLNPEEFDLVMTEMTDAADNMVALIRCTRLAAEAASETPVEVIESPRAVEEVPKLEGARLAKVEALFKEWDFENKGEIDRVKVSASAVKFGPHKSRLFHQLESMDTDGDNIISLDEMKIFFQVVSPQLNDEDFGAVRAPPPFPRPPLPLPLRRSECHPYCPQHVAAPRSPCVARPNPPPPSLSATSHPKLTPLSPRLAPPASAGDCGDGGAGG